MKLKFLSGKKQEPRKSFGAAATACIEHSAQVGEASSLWFLQTEQCEDASPPGSDDRCGLTQRSQRIADAQHWNHRGSCNRQIDRCAPAIRAVAVRGPCRIIQFRFRSQEIDGSGFSCKTGD